MWQYLEISCLLRLLLIHFLFFMFVKLPLKIKYERQNRWIKPQLFVVALIYAFIIYIASFQYRDFFILPFLFAGSFLINGLFGINNSKFIKMLISQICHVLLLVISWLLLIGLDLITGSIDLILYKTIFINIVNLFEDQKILAIILGYIIIIFPAGIFIGLLTEPFRKQLPVNKSRGLENAGLWIGCLERILIYSFVITNYLTAIALLITAKSIFRFGEIKEPENRKEAEYILIGSILSIGMAMVSGFIVRSSFK